MGGLPPLNVFPQYYWAVVGTVIATATIVNVYNHILCRQRYANPHAFSPQTNDRRLSAARAGRTQPAKPKSWTILGIATLFAFVREASNFSIRIPFKDRFLRLPTIGRITLVVANIVTLIVLCLYGFDLSNRWMRETIGYRCGFVTIGQLPLIFLLAGKNNIIGYLTGISYERLNWLHRWCARCMLLTATIHMGYFFADWAPYNYIGTQLKENTLVWKGVVAWAMLVWIVFSSMTPIRGWCYELFVLQHLVSFAVMVGFIYIHTPAEVHNYIWFPVGIFWLDRVVRIIRVLYANVSFFHPNQRDRGQMSGFWACNAEFTPLPHRTTRIVIENPPISWTPGQHVFLSCQSIVPLQSHPFTIASIPEDGRMEFLVKAETGGTKRFFTHAEKTHGLPASDQSCAKTVTIEGPYGCLRPLRQFDSVVLLAGSTGATFTVPLLRDIFQGWRENAEPSGKHSFFKPCGAVTRHVRFVWIVKSRGQLGWFSEQLSSVHSEFTSLQARLREIKLELTIYITCDESFTEEHKTLLSTLTAPNLNLAPKRPQQPQHGNVEIRSRVSSLDEKVKLDNTQEVIKEVGTKSLSAEEEAVACGPDGTCCCKTTIDETSPDAIQPDCCCRSSGGQQATVRPWSQVSSVPSNSPQKPLLHPSILVYAGRPKPKDIIRKSLEQALGESAVVVCGPQGLVADVKQDVCSLSDERAVHKGTGAQGIYLHTESFSY
jgi:predicted ferric reductase